MNAHTTEYDLGVEAYRSQWQAAHPFSIPPWDMPGEPEDFLSNEELAHAADPALEPDNIDRRRREQRERDEDADDGQVTEYDAEIGGYVTH